MEKLLRADLAACGAARITRTRALLDRDLAPLATFFNSLLEIVVESRQALAISALRRTSANARS